MRASLDAAYGVQSISDLLLRRGFWRVCRVRRQRFNGAALGISHPPHRSASARQSRGMHLCCEVVHARGRDEDSQWACELCDGDDLVQALKPQHTRGHSLTNTALERYAGRVLAHSGTPPSNECNLPSKAALAD